MSKFWKQKQEKELIWFTVLQCNAIIAASSLRYRQKRMCVCVWCESMLATNAFTMSKLRAKKQKQRHNFWDVSHLLACLLWIHSLIYKFDGKGCQAKKAIALGRTENKTCTNENSMIFVFVFVCTSVCIFGSNFSRAHYFQSLIVAKWFEYESGLNTCIYICTHTTICTLHIHSISISVRHSLCMREHRCTCNLFVNIAVECKKFVAMCNGES